MFTLSSRTLMKSLALAIITTVAGLCVHVYASGGALDIPSDQSCGKCGMFPANYPQWQSQIIFKDGSMAPFDGCKCMFGFMFNMGEYDKDHSSDDIAAVWVKDFNSGEWIAAQEATYVVGSDEMGPMGKELIPFASATTATEFHKAHGGDLATYDAITMATLQPLMGKMNMKVNDGNMKNMKMEGMAK